MVQTKGQRIFKKYEATSNFRRQKFEKKFFHSNDPQLWSYFEPHYYLALYARCK